jgi:hypothetical protein
MSNFYVHCSRPQYLEEHRFLTTDDKLASLLTMLLEKYPDLHKNGKIAIEPTEMEFFDGRP